ncbi:MAG: helix-hairpin-helix repeat-containing competence protein ComEA, competence protein ComEA [Candidatus Gottesmanbacteria bacterium GW2011_GWA2_43_14]|uniref:Helix-hairpin-helix repeat-containing competence protein ComEA, competence protein ComEA n=1 Tax=Candidatus Gottesmanbacteria bacterium GW2011_GWA2_43_14 TaxID=1618443 RepID=A0A0G1FS28_9BACT|nr:MAG: helix-hairpin-helix repeat-containing competence protein ComEA, competence protein ComEA [Candidatus Gottesmanbacteria bacterium GW2011_GWA2_43_14]
MSFDDEQSPLVNTEKLQDLISYYKFPLILAALGAGLAIFSFSLVGKDMPADDGMVFSTEANSSASAQIKVDIEGSVLNPGLYEFSDGARIEDALESAGGLSDNADLDWIEKNINKAARLIDGGKVYVPARGEAKQTGSAFAVSENNLLGVTTGLININNASQAELEALPGVGPVTAGKIISGRPYGKIEELKEKKAVGDALFDKIRDKLTI